MAVFCIVLAVLCLFLAAWLVAELRKNSRAQAALKAAEDRAAQAEISLGQERVLRGVAEKNSAAEAAKNAEIAEENLRLKTAEARMAERERALVEKISDFEAFSAKVFEDARKKFENSNKTQLDAILAPLKENLSSFRKRVDDAAVRDAEKYGSLERQINMLSEMSQKVSGEATRLANALMAQNKTAGDWGEMVLQSILQSCGLEENVSYVVQDPHTQDGQRRFLDALVRMPDGRNLIIDSKVSLVNYVNYCNASAGEKRSAELDKFLASVRTHIKTLSDKKYEELDVENPGFVMMFIPVEGAFELAITKDADLLEFANSKKIALACPSTLYACMRTVETLWRIEKQNKNTLEIAELGKVLHERICLFFERFAGLGKSIERVRGEYAQIEASLASGKGIAKTAARLADLGAKSKKNIEKKFLEDSGDE